MKPGDTITLQGTPWRVQKSTPKSVTLWRVEEDGPLLIAWRGKRKINQRQAAPLLGISQSFVAKIEKGDRALPDEARDRMKSK